jgi:hypothetical protein
MSAVQLHISMVHVQLGRRQSQRLAARTYGVGQCLPPMQCRDHGQRAVHAG